MLSNLLLKVRYVKMENRNWGFPDGSVSKAFACSAGDARDAGSVPGSGRSPGVGNVSPLQYSCLENLMDREAWWTKSMESKKVEHN